MVSQSYINGIWLTSNETDEQEHEESDEDDIQNVMSRTDVLSTSSSSEVNPDRHGVETLHSSRSSSPRGVLRNATPSHGLDPLELNDVGKQEKSVDLEPLEHSMSDEMTLMFEKLIDENGNLDMRNVTTLIWLNRYKPNMIQTITERLMANSSDRVVFNGIEFYLPQLAHMIIHLNVPTSALEQFSLVICQQSLMVALQLQWILLSALEDYQPERPDGTANLHYEPLYFNRCVKFFQRVEIIVALGPPTNDLDKSENMTDNEIEVVQLEGRKVQANKAMMRCRSISKVIGISRGTEGEGGERSGTDIVGFLLHKRWYKRSRPHSHSWIRRYFRIHGNVITCYCMLRNGCSRLKRALVLAGAHVEANPLLYKGGKYEYYFEIRSTLGCWRLRATNKTELELWIDAIGSAIKSVPMICKLPSSSQAMGNENFVGLSNAQQKRFEFFCQERNFVRDLTDICEQLRFVKDVESRADVLEHELQGITIPEDVFLPLCKSVDPYQRIMRIVPGEAKAFSTKERVPTLIMVESVMTWHAGEKDDLEPLDVANYMYWTYVHDKEAAHPIIHDMHSSTRALYNTTVDTSSDSTLKKAFSMGGEGDEEEQSRLNFFPRGLLSRPHERKPSRSSDRFSDDVEEMPTVELNISTAGIGSKHPEQPKHRKFRNVWRDRTTLWTPGSVFPSSRGRPGSGERRRSKKISRRVLDTLLHRNDESKSTEQEDDVIETAAFEGGDEEEGSKISSKKSIGSDIVSLSSECRTEGEAPIVDADQVMSYGESLQEKAKRLFLESPCVQNGWGLQGFIAKSNDDLRQEVFVMQLVSFYSEVFHKEGLDLWLQPYQILGTGRRTGLIELLENSLSIASSKKKDGWPGSLNAHFERLYGKPGSRGLHQARRKFAQSLAGYSVLCYLLSIKDRHNGNIMLTSEGQLIHIDFGFVFGQAPGNQFSFERAAFKITQEYIDTLGGEGSEGYNYFARMLEDGLIAARKYASQASILIEIMMFHSEFPCFKNMGMGPLLDFRRRIFLNSSEEQVRVEVRNLLKASINHIGTRLYDQFQRLTNGILP